MARRLCDIETSATTMLNWAGSSWLCCIKHAPSWCVEFNCILKHKDLYLYIAFNGTYPLNFTNYAHSFSTGVWGCVGVGVVVVVVVGGGGGGGGGGGAPMLSTPNDAPWCNTVMRTASLTIMVSPIGKLWGTYCMWYGWHGRDILTVLNT